MTIYFRTNLVTTSVLSRRILTTYVPLRTKQERERVFEEIALSRTVLEYTNILLQELRKHMIPIIYPKIRQRQTAAGTLRLPAWRVRHVPRHARTRRDQYESGIGEDDSRCGRKLRLHRDKHLATLQRGEQET